MKKLLALALALVMMLSCANALAMELDLDSIMSGGATVLVEMNLDPDFMNLAMSMSGTSVPEQVNQLMPSIVNIINKLGVQLSVGGDKLELDALLSGAELAGIGLTATSDGGLVIVSDMLPTSVITVSPETLQQLLTMVQQYASQLNQLNIDPEQLANAILPPLQQLIAAISEKAGQPEQGLYTVDGYMFSQKIPVNITTKELASAVLTCARDIVGAPYVRQTVQNIAKMMGTHVNVSTADIDSALLSLENTPDEKMPDLVLELYANSDSYYLVMDMSKDGEAVTVHGGVVGENTLVLTVNALDQYLINANIAVDEEAMQLNARVDMEGVQEGIYVGATLQGGLTQDGGVLNAALYFMNKAKPAVSATVTVKGGASFLLDYNTAGKNEVSVDALISGDQTAQNTLLADLQTSLFSLIAKAQQAMPEEMNALMQVIMSMQNTGY